MGATMTILTPDEQRISDVYFTCPWVDDYIQARLSIVASDYPVAGLLLNDDDIGVSCDCGYIVAQNILLYQNL